MSASKLKHSTSINTSSKESSSSSSAYTAYNAVDELVAKPVFGSDGAKKWQSFAAAVAQPSKSSVAPTVPLKAIDRATGFTSWKEEREYSNQIRQNDNHAKNSTSSGYTNFTGKGNQNKNEMSSKERKRIERRIIGDQQEYFIPSATFDGWKFDYVFTTRVESHGTGYYFDGMDSLKLLRGQISEDDIPSSAKILSCEITTKKRPSLQATGDVDEATTTLTGKNDDAEPIKKKKKKAKNLAPVIVNNPNHPLEQIAAILAQRQQPSSSSSLSDSEAILLPVGWEVAKDSQTGQHYFFNRTTGERSWERPTSAPQFPCVTTTNTTTTTKTPSCPNGWNVTRDPSSGKEYYYHAQTGETSWEKPTTT